MNNLFAVEILKSSCNIHHQVNLLSSWNRTWCFLWLQVVNQITMVRQFHEHPNGRPFLQNLKILVMFMWSTVTSLCKSMAISGILFLVLEVKWILFAATSAPNLSSALWTIPKEPLPRISSMSTVYPALKIMALTVVHSTSHRRVDPPKIPTVSSLQTSCLSNLKYLEAVIVESQPKLLYLQTMKARTQVVH